MPELRYEPVTKTWVIIATERAKRPSNFAPPRLPRKEGQECPFCPGNEKATPPEVMAYRPKDTVPDSPGWQVRVVPNKFPALNPEAAAGATIRRDFFHAVEGAGAHEVIIETPDHERSFATQEADEILLALRSWQDRYIGLGENRNLAYTQIFKNHGAVAGASLEHPHSQLIATPLVPVTLAAELANTGDYYAEHGRCFFCDALEKEEREGSRLAWRDENVVAFCPFASRFPLEVWFLPRRHQESFAQATKAQLFSLAGALQAITRRLFTEMRDPPFNLLLHSTPYRGGDYHASYHWHLELLPRVTIIAGFELGTGMYINPTPPEMAGEFYRAE